MLHGLAEQGQAPRSFARTSRNGVPVMTVITMIVALLVGVALNYLYPDQALFLLGALATFATLLVWLIILAAHLRMKRVIAQENRLPSEFPIPLWPFGSWITVAFIVFVVVMVSEHRPRLTSGPLGRPAVGGCAVAVLPRLHPRRGSPTLRTQRPHRTDHGVRRRRVSDPTMIAPTIQQAMKSTRSQI